MGVGQHFEREGLAASLGQDCRSRSSQVLQVALAQEIETEAEDAIENDMDDKPDHDQIDHGLDNPSPRLANVLKRPIPQEHVLPEADQNHHGQVHDEWIREPSDGPPGITEDIPGEPCYQKENHG